MALAADEPDEVLLARLHGKRAVALMAKGCLGALSGPSPGPVDTTAALGCVAQRLAGWLAELRGSLLLELEAGEAMRSGTSATGLAAAGTSDRDRDSAVDAIADCDERGAALVFEAAAALGAMDAVVAEDLEGAPWVRCVAKRAEPLLAFAIRETRTARAKKEALADAWVDKACASAPPPADGARRRTLVNGTGAAAVLVDGFATEKECAHLKAATMHNLTAATEPLNVVRYGPGDAYPGHCDGSCDGTPYLPGGRVASVVVYCEAAAAGGDVVFPGAGVRPQSPAPGSALFLGYRDERDHSPSLHLMDGGLTRHAGCEVTAGEKWVLTLFLRDGVDNYWRQWWAFDTYGRPAQWWHAGGADFTPL
ncbi:procollagen-proline 4-dioxygenase [Aureococcus anophagefferens]|uniref:Procollagen-proline 4-dioxygenase n=1 Tax=Aureococcus anophagefferens TaxID=44056 RepID=A0ABR1FRS3_AURAN